MNVRVARSTHRSRTATLRSIKPRLDALESRSLLSLASLEMHPMFNVGTLVTNANPPSGAYTPAQIETAYGFNKVLFNGTVGNGSNETIAIVDAYNDPNIQADLNKFDTQFGLPSTTVTQYNETGGTTLPASDSTGGWELEESLDVEWAHAMAPGAKIDLVEASSADDGDLLAAVQFAATQANVVSMSWGGGEFSGETSYDSYFSKSGVAFVASSGDAGAPIEWPAASPNVLAVGGTALTLGTGGVWSSETGWSGSGGGPSAQEAQPAYQHGVVTQTTTQRANPDVAYDASPSTGFAVYDSVPYSGTAYGWIQVGGTSAGAPQWSALLAIADQGRALAGKAALDSTSPQEVMTTLYANESDFHDITTGTSTGSPHYSAGTGYDYVTGLGTPIANLVVGSLDGTVTTVSNDTLVLSGPTTATAGTSFSLTVTADTSAGVTDGSYRGTIEFSSTDVNAGLPANYTFTAADDGSHTFTITLKTAGSQAITAKDTTTSAITGTLSGITVSPAAASQLILSGLGSTATAGTAQSVTVTAEDPYGNVATGYAGTVKFTSSDTSAVLPASYTFTTSDKGIHTFSLTFKTAGTQSVTVTDSTAGFSATKSGIVVSPAAPTNLVATVISSSQINLTWTGAAGATGYAIQESSNGTSGWTQVGTTAAGTTSYQQTGLVAGTTYYFRVLATAGSASSGASNTVSATTTGTPSSTYDSIWSNSYTPSENAYSYGSYEVGVKFMSSVAGVVTGARFYKESFMNGATHVGHLWSSSGVLLATATFTNETSSGWQTVAFSTPVAILANTTYIVSFSTGGGDFGISTSFFSSGGVTNGPLQAEANSVSGGDGVYNYAGQFPDVDSNGMNFWADVTFTPGSTKPSGGKGSAAAAAAVAGSPTTGSSSFMGTLGTTPTPGGPTRFNSGSKSGVASAIGTIPTRRVVPQVRTSTSWRSSSSLAPGSLDV